MYAYLLRKLPVPLAKALTTIWYCTLLLLLWLQWMPASVGFRYGQI